jgi:hypothetical protein
MAITITSRPYAGKKYKILPVYNGLRFTIQSSFASTPNFKYICEVWSSSNKLGELRHNPDISLFNSGVFDVGRVLEDYILWTLSYGASDIVPAPTSAISYYLKFGEEYTRALKPSLISIWSLESVPSVKINTTREVTISPSSSRPSAVYIEGSSNTALNGFFEAYSWGNNEIIVKNSTFAAGTYGDLNNITILQGEYFTGVTNWIGANGAQLTILNVKINNASRLFKVGDKIFGKSVGSTMLQMENIEWTISKITNVGEIYSLYTNIPYSAVPSNTSGFIVSRNNYQKLSLIDTQADKAVATNGVEQYDTYPDYEATPYIPNPMPLSSTSLPNVSKFLTKRAVRSTNICLEDYFTLSAFHPVLVDANIADRASGWMVELWRTTNPYSSPLTPSAIYNVNYTVGRITLEIPGNIVVSNGSMVTVTGFKHPTGFPAWNAFTFQSQVMASNYNVGLNKTIIVLLEPTASGTTYVTDASHLWSFKVDQMISYYPYDLVTNGVIDVNTTLPVNRVELPAGPKNLASKVSMSDVSKYYIFPIAKTPSYLTAITLPTFSALGIVPYKVAGERFEFIVNCECTKYKKWTLTWLNELGGWDWFTFDARTDKTRNIDKATFDKKLQSNYSYGDKGKSAYNTKSRDTWTMRSKFLSADELNWLSYIYESPEVYIIDYSQNTYQSAPTPKAIPVNIMNTDVELYNKVNISDRGSLYQYTIIAEAANERIVQRGSNFGGAFYNRQ